MAWEKLYFNQTALIRKDRNQNVQLIGSIDKIGHSIDLMHKENLLGDPLTIIILSS